MIRNPVLRETQNLIRESLKMATAIRSSARNRTSKTLHSEDNQNDVLKRLKLRLHSHLNEIQIFPIQVKDSPLKPCKLMQISIAP